VPQEVQSANSQISVTVHAFGEVVKLGKVALSTSSPHDDSYLNRALCELSGTRQMLSEWCKRALVIGSIKCAR
jgi:hypothetical protein